jgi:uncharacterized phage-associated protein
MYSSLGVANEFLKLANGAGRDVNAQQLSKLTYLANAWSLALDDKRLVKEVLEAWKYGPMQPELYEAVKKFGGDAVTEVLPAPLGGLKEADLRRIKEVYVIYGGCSGPELSAMTNGTGSPFSGTAQGCPIKDRVIQEFYRARLLAQLRP